MPESPLISVIVPVYNTEQYLRKCLDSICGQTYPHLEILCVNDGSTDNSAAILEEYAAKDSRIKIIHQENAGLSAARNTGLDHATGEWIAGVDSDDYLEPDAYEYALNIPTDGVDIIHFGVNVIWDGVEKEADVARTFSPFAEGPQQVTTRLLQCSTVTFWDKLWRRSFVEQYACRFPKGLLYEDNYFWWALAPYASSIYRRPEPKINYLRRSGSIMSQTNQGTAHRLHLIEMAGALLKHYSQFPLPERLKHTRITSFLHLYQGACLNLLPELRPRLQQEATAIAKHHKLFDSYPAALRFLKPLPGYLRLFAKHRAGKSSYCLFGLPLITIQSKQGVETTRLLGIKIRTKSL